MRSLWLTFDSWNAFGVGWVCNAEAEIGAVRERERERWCWGKWGSMRLGGRLGRELLRRWNSLRTQKLERAWPWRCSTAAPSSSTRWSTRLHSQLINFPYKLNFPFVEKMFHYWFVSIIVQIKREISIMKLVRHPYVVRLYEACDNSFLFL